MEIHQNRDIQTTMSNTRFEKLIFRLQSAKQPTISSYMGAKRDILEYSGVNERKGGICGTTGNT